MKNLKLLLLIPALLASSQGLASDHIDGPVTTGHRVADLTDLYAFPTPKKPGFMTVILDAYPIVSSTGHFTDKVTYNLIIRRANIRNAESKPGFDTSDEVTIACTFKTPDNTADHVVRCQSSNGLLAENRYEVVQEQNVGDDFRLYAGMRSDPFFFNANFATEAAKGKLPPPANNNIMDQINVLSIVMELDMSKLYKSDTPSLIAIAAESTTQDGPGAPVRRLDRVGRPEITNVSLVARTEADLRDQFNLDRPFRVAVANQKAYQQRLASNIAFYDDLDGEKNWQDKDREDLATILADDFLVVDLSRPCSTAAFFDIEKAIIKQKKYDTCGGRKPTDDIMDTYFSLYVAGLDGKHIGDGVDHPYEEVSEQFPHLAEPTLGFFARLKASAAKLLLGVFE